ncbi:MAG: mannose-1-phosphate guanylyltransferase/mannose-6-phosphate isomerase [Gammaproteobacteria bacterium]|nr:mannose-1-phosphate guanylyltransferase/mannose-6-phosphate isomerase [Gammaproteobacteria bacterium]
MLFPVILAGGSGTRLWPLSRSLYSKQFLALTSEQSLLQQTAARASELCDGPLMIVGNEDHRFLVAQQMQQLDQPCDIVLEPLAKNTAPAIAIAALHALSQHPEARIFVMPADHSLELDDTLKHAINRAYQLTEQNKIATFGIAPTKPETGYGYIQKGDVIDDLGFSVSRFVEKPDRATAEQYLQSGQYLWNSGMFVMAAQQYLDELAQHAPAMHQAARAAYAAAARDMDFIRIDATAYAQSASDSIDFAVMEKTQHAAVVSLDTTWNDIGSWSALWDELPKDENGNANFGDCVTLNSQNCLVHSGSRLVATLGMKNTVVVETKDAVLVADKSKVQDVKHIVEHLKAQGRSEHTLHREVHRPWGRYDSIDQAPGYLVKRITVLPHQKLSLQYHHHRAEHWVVVKGTATVHLNGETHTLQANQSIYIPTLAHHSLENQTDEDLEIIEVQTGEILSEDDIVRLDDRYGRSEGKSIR